MLARAVLHYYPSKRAQPATVLWGRLATCGRLVTRRFALAQGRPTPAAWVAREITRPKPTHFDCGHVALRGNHAAEHSRRAASRLPRIVPRPRRRSDRVPCGTPIEIGQSLVDGGEGRS